MRNRKSGFSLIELIIAVSILAILASVVMPYFISLFAESRTAHDEIKFESICTTFKTSMGTPEVQKELEKISTSGDILVVCPISTDGVIDFELGKIYGSKTKDMGSSELWKNSYQMIGYTYQVEDKSFCGKYIVFELVPKTEMTTAKCTYSIEDSNPKG